MARQVLIVMALLLAVACGGGGGVQPSGIDASATVTISGKAVGGDGHPLANTKVALIKELDLGEMIGGLFLTATSLGLACLADKPVAICANNSHVATTDGNGAYSFSLKGSDTQGSFGLASTMEVITRAPARVGEVNGPVALAEFKVQANSLTLPDLHVWQPSITPAGNSAAQRSNWPDLPSSYGSSPSYTLEFFDLHANQWWVSGPITSGKWVDGRILEDLNGSFDVVARSHGTASGTTIDFTYVSGSVPVHGYAGPPPSRNAFCAPVTTDGVGAFSFCALTSGNLAQTLAWPNGAALDMGQDRALVLAVIRGCSAQCKVAVSSDLSTWSDAGVVSGPYATVSITLNRSAQYVRLTGAVGGVRQISVW